MIRVYTAQSSRQVVSRTRIVPEDVIALCIVCGCAQIAIRCARLAWHNVAPSRDVVKCGRVLRCQGVEDVVRLPLRPIFLFDQRQNARHRRRRCRRPSNGSNGQIAIRNHAIPIFRTDGISSVVLPRRGKQRYIGKVTHSVAGNALSGLPRRLGISSRARTVSAIGSLSPGRAIAGSAAARNDVGNAGVVDASIVEVQSKRIVPRLLRHGLQKRCRGINGGDRVPVSLQLRLLCGRSSVVAAVIEVGATHRNVPGSGTESIHGNPVLRRLVVIEIIAACWTAIPGRDERGLPLRRRLLPQGIPEQVSRRSQILFTGAVARAEDRGLIIIHRSLGGQQQSRLHGGVGCGV